MKERRYRSAYCIVSMGELLLTSFLELVVLHNWSKFLFGLHSDESPPWEKLFASVDQNGTTYENIFNWKLHSQISSYQNCQLLQTSHQWTTLKTEKGKMLSRDWIMQLIAWEAGSIFCTNQVALWGATVYCCCFSFAENGPFWSSS